jgi:hypothetical protein
MTSRYITRWNIPNISNLRGRFEYVFFAKDERTDRTGNPKFEAASHDLANSLGDPADENSLSINQLENGLRRTAYSIKAPRFVELSFNQTRIGPKDRKNFRTPDVILRFLENLTQNRNASQGLNSEENVSSSRDVVFRGNDSKIKDRLNSKLNLLLNLNKYEEKDVAEAIKELNLQCSDSCISLLGLNSQQGLDVIDESNNVYSSTVLSSLSNATYEMLLDASRSEEIFFSLEERTGFSKIERAMLGRELQAVMVNQGEENGSLNDRPTLNCLFFEEADRNVDSFDAYGVKVQGYLVYKRETLSNGNSVPLVADYLNADGRSGSLFNYFDTKVVYGSDYEYSIRTVLLVRTLHVSNGEPGGLDEGKYYAYSLMASKESDAARLKAIETVPPSEPDGIFYDFMYSKGEGLRIRWQMPPDKQRDVKYFQVFRRKSINEPFTCLAELDFDDSEVRSMKSEIVQIDRVYRTSHPALSFVDSEFGRGSKYIYAVAALDAHGMSSGYSEQMEVSFNRVENKIRLTSVSRSGAPKQYPNLYVRPNLSDGTRTRSLTQDAMLFSNAQKLMVYFDPDASTYESDSGASGRIVSTIQEGGTEYKIHLLNLDRQFDDVLRIRLK